MKLLAIETSCDDTCLAVLEGEKVLSSLVSSQEEIHRKWGGVYPTLARREHQKNLTPLLEKALKESNLLKEGFSFKEEIEEILEREEILFKDLKEFLSNYKKPEIDFLAVTIGPGLDPSLWTGINFTKALAFCWDLKVVPVNHIKAHFFAPLLLEKPEFPTVSLIVSGGHTQLILSLDMENHRLLGETRDDAAGECLDKTARILGLEYPGGPAIEREAKKGEKISPPLPRPMIKSKDFDFSFSGLKTAVLYRKEDSSSISSMAREIQEAISEVLIYKTIKAAKKYKAKTIIIGGGVTANKFLREKFLKEAKENNLRCILPSFDLCTDNAKMIAITASHQIKKGEVVDWESLESIPNLKIE